VKRAERAPSERRWFHYSKGFHLGAILRDGRLRPATAGVVPPERPAVWFSCREDCEPTALMGKITEDGALHVYSIAEMVAAVGPLTRFEVDAKTATYSWVEHLRRGRIDRQMAQALVDASREQGAEPAEWRLTYRNVPLKHVRAIEWSEDGQAWHPAIVLEGERLTIDPVLCSKVREAWARRQSAA
jgi:hypothetical protein